MKWFQNPQTLEDLKKQYKKLVFQYHPDCGGKTEDMQEINNEYDQLFIILKSSSKQDTTTADQDKQDNSQFKDIISKIIHLDCTIEIIGSWIWISGNTYQYKDILNALSFKWCKNKKAWSWHPDSYIKHSKKQFSMNDIRTLFGSEKVQNQIQYKLA